MPSALYVSQPIESKQSEMAKTGIRFFAKVFGKMFSGDRPSPGDKKFTMPERRPFTFDVEYQPMDRCVKITTHGTYTKESNAELVKAEIDATRQYQTNLVFIDERDQENALKYTDFYDLPENYDRMHLPHSVRVAILFKPTQENLSQYRLYENRSVICGFKHHVFTDEPSARAWLFDSRPRMTRMN